MERDYSMTSYVLDLCQYFDYSTHNAGMEKKLFESKEYLSTGYHTSYVGKLISLSDCTNY